MQKIADFAAKNRMRTKKAKRYSEKDTTNLKPTVLSPFWLV